MWWDRRMPINWNRRRELAHAEYSHQPREDAFGIGDAEFAGDAAEQESIAERGSHSCMLPPTT